VRIGEFLAQEIQEGLEPLDAVGRARIVLDVFRPEVFRRRFKILLVQPGLVEFEYGFPVGLRIGGVCRGDQQQGGNDEDEPIRLIRGNAFRGEDLEEGLKAFADKRPPSFTWR